MSVATTWYDSAMVGIGSRFDANSLPKVEIHVTELCNNRCTFCTTGWVNLERADMVHPPRSLIRAQLEEAFAGGARRALFQGGEPTLRRDLGDLIADARQIGFTVTTLFTNGRMAASRAGARWLMSMGVDWFQISVQGGNAAAHDASVAATGAFAQTVDGIRRLVQLGQRVKINAVLTRHLLESLDDFAELMIELAPEEVGLDTVKPSAAFGAGREDYRRLLLRLSDFSTALRDAVTKMNRAGVVARLTSFPPCLVPGAEAYVSEETPEVRFASTRGDVNDKLSWKRSLQVKAPACAGCAYDASCGGVYHPYAELHGLDELKPIAEKHAPKRDDVAGRRPDSALTAALRALLVRASPGARVGVAEVERCDEGHLLRCFSPEGELLVTLGSPDQQAAFARTARFSVAYRTPGARDGRVDLRLLHALVETLRRAERNLPLNER